MIAEIAPYAANIKIYQLNKNFEKARHSKIAQIEITADCRSNNAAF